VANLEVKDRMSPLQLAIVVFMLMVAAPGPTLSPIVKEAGHGAWLSVLAGGSLYYGVAWLMLRLGAGFPEENMAEYMPRLWGRWLGGATVWLFVGLIFLAQSNVLQTTSRQITFFMFDRTPYEVVEAGMLLVCAYCALQEWGTILRVTQLMFFTAFPMSMLLLASGLLGFRFIDFLPLWPADAAGVAAGALDSWALFGGYEAILLLLPLVYRGKAKPAVAVAGAFGLATAVFSLWVALAVGGLTLEVAKNLPFPLLTVVREVEIPGTFVERLDTYYLLFWLQVIFTSMSLSIYLMAQALTTLYGYADHRPLVLALIPLLFLVGDAAHYVRVYEGLQQISQWAGWLFSLGVAPASAALVWWRRRADSGA
jgi:spore germination protein